MPRPAEGASLSRMESEPLGAKFWLWLLGGVVLIGLAGLVIFTVFGAVWYAWGALAAVAVLCGLIALVASLGDKFQARRYGRTTGR
jgi:hypothetical protein